MSSLNITVMWVGAQSKRTSNSSVMTTSVAGKVVATNSSKDDYNEDESIETNEKNCHAIFTSPPRLLHVVNCSEAWNLVCMKQASPLRGQFEGVTKVQPTAKFQSFTSGGYSTDTVYAMIAVGSVVILLLLLSWPVYFSARWLRSRRFLRKDTLLHRSGSRCNAFLLISAIKLKVI